jgi:tetratricopeptide (TPR) repeat protein
MATLARAETPTRRLAVALALTALGCEASLASAVELTSSLGRYRQAIHAYRSEGVEGAKVRVKALDSAEAISAVMELQRQMNRADASPVNDWTSEALGVAVVVHLELYVETARVGPAAPWHLEAAGILLGLHGAVGGEPKLRRQAAVALAWLLQIAGRFDLLGAHLSISLKEFTDEPALLVVQAVLYEAAASPRFRESSATTAVVGLNRAARSYRRVLELDPASAEVRARLGFVLIRLKRRDEARAQLELALRGADSPRSIYLAALFLGRTFESEGNLESATGRYRQAHDAAPRCQVAALALSNALMLSGNREAAVAVASRAARDGPDKCDDPWWSYDYGQAWRLDATLRALRGDALR